MKKNYEFESEINLQKAEAERKANFVKFLEEYRKRLSDCRTDFVEGSMDIAHYASECSRPIVEYMDSHERDEREWRELENILCEFLFPGGI